MDRKTALLILNALSDLGPVRIKRLLERFQEPEEVLSASRKELISVEGIGEKGVERIRGWNKYFNIEKEYKRIEEEKIRVICIGDQDYPELLAKIEYPPCVLYVKGVLEIQHCIAIVGSRNPTYYGIETAKLFGMELAQRGITVVSGFARGIDTAAHKGALISGGSTIAVFGSGIDVVYPPENEGLVEKIVEKGAIVSEFPLGTPPYKQNFPRRNRIISGFSMGVIVVEAGKRSGSLITARLAVEQGREVFSVPGRIDSAVSKGTNVLIKDGAKPVTCIEDVLEEFGEMSLRPATREEEETSHIRLNEMEEKICKVIGEEGIDMDSIVEKTGLSVPILWQYLSVLELKGILVRLPGNVWKKASIRSNLEQM